MKTLKIIIFFTISFGFFSTCKKDDNPNACHNAVIYYNYLTDAARNQTPYFNNPAFDTLSFASDKGDTLTFVKTKTDSTWYKEEISGNPACDWDKNYYQVLHNSYSTIKGNGSFDLKHSLKNSSFSNRIEIKFNNINFSFYDRFIGSANFGTYKSLILVNNIKYYDSVKIYEIFGDTTTSSILINKTYGVFQVYNIKSNTAWSLIKM